MNPLAKNLLIRASAGSGKTYQLGNRVIGLVALGVPPEQIAALTFTRKAAGEFADSVLTKLARAASDAATGDALARTLELPGVDFTELLAKVVRALPVLMLGTMDSFFAKVVRSFQYELGVTGGRFDLLEGAELEAARDGLLAEILGARLDADADDPFFHAFRRAMAGREVLRVAEGLREFVRDWLAVFRETADLRWGPAELAGVEVGDWERDKHGLLARVWPGVEDFEETRKDQRQKMGEILDALAVHTIGSGSLSDIGSLFASLLAAVAETSAGALRLRYHKDFDFPEPAAGTLRALVGLLVRCELAGALDRTRGVRAVMAVYDGWCEARLRRRGKLGFDDVKFLMGRWSRDETARLRREWVDFRLDSRHGHWLLDEFQDTSRADWLGLQPLIDEAATADDGTVFIVGDRKQAIYGWRGGEVGLFDEVEHRYHGGLATADMAESWRSCPQVLELVNRVCGAKEIMAELFGDEAVDRWHWDDHISAPHLSQPAKAGEARVEIVDGKLEGRLERMVAILRDELGVGRRALSCGVLLRSNELVRQTADFLREHGFDVIEDGRRQPAKDHPVGVAIAHLIRWLADPANRFARGVVAMSPFGPELLARHGGWRSAWTALTTQCAQAGMAAMVGELVRACDSDWSAFGQRRAAELIAALQALDTRDGTTLATAADHLQRLEISQTPGVAAVQVLTIHKAKGLGFDIVMLPAIPTEAVPNAARFSLATGADWLTQPPAKWARDLLPDLREAEARWAADQRYEAMCLFYVALTRAKRGLYLLLDPLSQKAEPDHPSHANWLARALESANTPGIIFQAGDPDWARQIPESPAPPREAAPRPRLGPAIPRRARRRPTAVHAVSGAAAAGAAFGTAVHLLFERISWLDEATPDLPDDEAGRLVAALLTLPEIRTLLERRGSPVRLLREQPVEAAIDHTWLAGVIDRLHLHHDPDGTVTDIDLIDFKTDAVATPDELLARHREQLASYRAALARGYPAARIRAHLLSTHLRELVSVDL